MNTDRCETLLGPVVAALDAASHGARSRGPLLDAAGQWLEFKFYAALHVSDQIHEQLRAGTSTIQAGTDALIHVVVDRSVRFALYVLVDSFLFEVASTKDALLQFVNVMFNLGISERDTRLPARIKSQLQVTSTSTTGLEYWLERSCEPAWLTWLLELRHATTHRRVVQLPEQYAYRDDGVNSPSWQGRVGIECSDGGYEPLGRFLDRTEREAADLLRISLERLRNHLDTVDPRGPKRK